MTIEDTLHINAPPDVVWAVTEDVEQWPDWTPTMTSVVRSSDGPFGLGSTARIKQPGQPESTWTVTQFEPGERFAWESRRTGLRMTAAHVLRVDGAGTANTLQVQITGILGVLLRPLLRAAVRKALSLENRGLQAHCEALASGPTHS